MLVGYSPIIPSNPAKVLVIVTGTTQQMVAGGHYVFSNTGAKSTGYLPPNPLINDEVTVDNATGRLDMIINRNGQLIDQLAENVDPFDVEGAITFIFVGGIYGWRIK